MYSSNHSGDYSMSKIYIDIGNSYIKAAKKNELSWQVLHNVRNESWELVTEELSKESSVDEIMISSVRKDVTRKLVDHLPGVEFRFFTSDQIPNYHLDYKTPKTLGIDRFLVCLAASRITSKNVVVIDTGTACTVDLMTSDKIYRGGLIMPGLEAFHTGMQARLPELPEVARMLPSDWPGKSTEECLQWGVNGAYLMAIRMFVDKYALEMYPIDVVITGGGAEYLKEMLGEVIRMRHRPNLIFEGMESFEKLLKENSAKKA